VISSLLTETGFTIFIGASAAFYLLPVLIGWARHVPDLGWIAVLNVLLGWTFAGWVVALLMAVRSVPRSGPVVQVVQNLPPSSPPPGVPDGAGWGGRPGPSPWRPDQAPPLLLPPRPAEAEQPASERRSPWVPEWSKPASGPETDHDWW
jgi:hypothetical protein